MVVVIFFAVGILLFVIQSSLFMLNPVWIAAPDLYFVLIAYLAYRLGTLESLLIIFPLSWFFDIFYGSCIGTYPIICLSAFCFFKFFSSRMILRESLYQIPLTGVCYLVVSRIVHLFFSIFTDNGLPSWSWPQMLVQAFLVILMCFPLFYIFEKIKKRFEGKFTHFPLLRLRSENRFRLK